MLSDLHDRLWGEKQKILLDAIDRLNGDLILCAGDMLIGKEQSRMENAILLFRELGKRDVLFTAATAIMSPECASSSQFMGGSINSMPDTLRSYGIKILENETETVKIGTARLQIHGYEMPLKYYRKLCMLPYDTRDLRQKFGGIHDGDFHILLAHNPVYSKHMLIGGQI